MSDMTSDDKFGLTMVGIVATLLTVLLLTGIVMQGGTPERMCISQASTAPDTVLCLEALKPGATTSRERCERCWWW